MENDTDGVYIESPLLSRIPGTVFYPVSQFLNHGEYSPSLLDHSTRLANTNTPEQKSLQMSRCAIIYCTAQILHISDLQHLVACKFKVLEPGCKHADFLNAIEMIFGSSVATATTTAAAAAATARGVASKGEHHQQKRNEKAEESFKEWLIETLAARFWDIMLAETELLARVLRVEPRLARNVFGLLAREKIKQVKKTTRDFLLPRKKLKTITGTKTRMILGIKSKHQRQTQHWQEDGDGDGGLSNEGGEREAGRDEVCIVN
jgi:hypothetical protein